MPSSGYAAITFVANEQPTTAKWNLIGSNDSSFNLGTGLEDNVILDRHILTGNLKTSKFSNPYKFSSYKSASSQGWSTTPSKCVMDGNEWDTGGNYSTVNSRFTAPIAGFYHFDAFLQLGAINAVMYIRYYVNGTAKKEFPNSNSGSGNGGGQAGCDLQLAAGDYVELWVFMSSGTPSTVNGAQYTGFNGHLISAT